MALDRSFVKRAVMSLIIGCGLGLLPLLFETFQALWPPPPLDNAVQLALGFLSFPGLMAGIVLAGNVHTYSIVVVVAVNIVAYSLIAFAVLRWRHNRHSRARVA
jgi:hypothetical protein